MCPGTSLVSNLKLSLGETTHKKKIFHLFDQKSPLRVLTNFSSLVINTTITTMLTRQKISCCLDCNQFRLAIITSMVHACLIQTHYYCSFFTKAWVSFILRQGVFSLLIYETSYPLSRKVNRTLQRK